MKLKEELDLENVSGLIFFTDGHLSRTGAIFRNGKEYELIYNKTSKLLASIQISPGDLVMIYSDNFFLRKKEETNFYEEGNSIYQERKEFFDKMSKKT